MHCMPSNRTFVYHLSQVTVTWLCQQQCKQMCYSVNYMPQTTSFNIHAKNYVLETYPTVSHTNTKSTQHYPEYSIPQTKTHPTYQNPTLHMFILHAQIYIPVPQTTFPKLNIWYGNCTPKLHTP